MKKWLVIFSSFVLVVSYQNCAQNPGLQQNEPTAENPTQYEKYRASGATVLTLWDNAHQRLLDVDLKTGRIESFEQYGNAPGGEFCLKGSEVAKLNEFLNSAEVCEPVDDVKPGELCSTIYQYPYAALVFGRDEVRLGERISGCSAAVHLCDGKSEKLQTFAACVISRLDARNCGQIDAVSDCSL